MKREVIVVLGMHRSGTSAVTRGLKALGVQLGDHLIKPGIDNPTGFWENKSILNLNIGLLSMLGLKWDSLPLIPSFQWNDAHIRQVIPKTFQIIEKNINSSQLWGFKDPRTLRVLPFWIEVFKQLKVTPKYLLVIRNPLSVASSLYYRNGIPHETAHLLWSIHTIPYLGKIKNQLRVVVDYDLLMANPIPQLKRIASGLSIPEGLSSNSEIQNYAKTFLSNDLRHSRYSEEDVDTNPLVNDLTAVGYHRLRRLAHDDISLSSNEFWQYWAGLEHALSHDGPNCRYMGHTRLYDPLATPAWKQQGTRPRSNYLPHNKRTVHVRDMGNMTINRRR